MDLIGKVRPLRHVFCRWMAWPFVLISGTPCQDAEFQQMTTEVQNGFKVLKGNGCPDHPMFLRLNQVWQVWWKNCFACFVYSFDSFFVVSFLWQRQNKIYPNCECWKYVIADQCRPHFWKPPGGREDEHWLFLYVFVWYILAILGCADSSVWYGVGFGLPFCFEIIYN